MPSRIRASDDGASAEPPEKHEGIPTADDADDTEGHGLLVDPYSARKLDNSRVAEAERASRERQLRKDARPGR